MRLVIIGFVLLAAVAAGGAALIAKRYIDSSSNAQVNTGIQKIEKETVAYVLVADEPITLGTTITKGAVRWQRWPMDGVEPIFISADSEEKSLLQKLVGTVIRQSVAAGTPITEDMVFRRGKAGFLAGIVDEGARAVSIKVDAVSSVSGFILPGDRVDVLLTFDVKQLTRGLERSRSERTESEADNKTHVGPAKYSTETILKNLRVLGIDQKYENKDNDQKVPKSVTLEVSPKQAEILAVGRAMGKLVLALRSYSGNKPDIKSETYTADIDISPTLQNIVSLLSEKKRRRAVNTSFPSGKKSRRASRAAKVRIIRGNQETTQEFPAR